jgi:saccharopine dehydrogenase-like NADP-dependent oxidoreductase
MKAIILGCGNIGSVAAEDLAQHTNSVEIVVADIDQHKARAVAKRINKKNVNWKKLDVSNQAELRRVLRQFDVAIGFLPGKIGFNVAKTCVAAGTDLVDVSFMGENPLLLHGQALKAKVTIVPDCGLAPGISNVLVGHAVSELHQTETVHIMVGGLPEKPVDPLGYTITWSPESLIDEYTRTVTIIQNRRRKQVEPLTGLESTEFPGVGELEAFFTDGLRTLPQTIKGVEEMWEKTLRYPGHAEKIRLLEALGLFDEAPISVDGLHVPPRKVMTRLIAQKLSRPEIGDIVALSVEVSGLRQEERNTHHFTLIDKYDRKRKITAMARTTAFPASIVAQMLLDHSLKEKGVVPPEKIGMDSKLFKRFEGELKLRNIKIEHSLN